MQYDNLAATTGGIPLILADLIARISATSPSELGTGDGDDPDPGTGPVTGGGAKLLARPAPPEPVPYTFNNGDPGVFSEARQAPAPDYDIDIAMPDNAPYRVFFAGNADFTSGVIVEQVTRDHAKLSLLKNGRTTVTNVSNAKIRQAGVEAPFLLRIRRKGNLVSIFTDEDVTKAVASYQLDGDVFSSTDRWIRIVNQGNNAITYTKMTVAPASLVTDRLILSDLLVDTKSGEMTATADYYLSTDDSLVMQVETLAGETVVPFEPVEIVSNTVPGKAKLRLRSKIPLIKRGSKLRFKTKAVADLVLNDTAEAIYPNSTVFGQNLAGLNDPFRPVRSYTNMMQQGYWQDSNQGTDNFTAYRHRGTPGVLDEKGWPLRKNLWFWYPLPDQRNVQVKYVLKWTGGPIGVSHFANGRDNGVVSVGAIQDVNANTKTWTMVADRTIAKNEWSGRFHIYAIDPANPPKNMTLCLEGEDLNQRFLPSFIDFMKLLPGRMRFMDSWGVNGELAFIDKSWDWATRPIQDNGSAIGFPFEDMMELAHRTNRPVTWNIHASYAYQPGGMEYYRKAVDLVYKGVDAKFFTPGFAMPNGIRTLIAPEVGNENWNPGFGGYGTYHYLVAAGRNAGITVTTTGDYNHALLCKMRNLAQTKLMTEIETRVPDWRSRTVRVVGLQMGEGDLGNLQATDGWGEAQLHIDECQFAPYIPNDANAGGQAVNVPDKSPAGICAFLTNYCITITKPNLLAGYSKALSAGFSVGVYEINISMISMSLSFDQIVALCRSQEFYDLWALTIIPMLVSLGGDISIYSDVGNIVGFNELWSLMHILDTDWNQGWDAVVDWSKAASA